MNTTLSPSSRGQTRAISPLIRLMGFIALPIAGCALFFALPLDLPISAQQTAPGGGDVDPAVVQACINTLGTYNVTPNDPEFLDALTACYGVEQASKIELEPLPENNVNDGEACFEDGATVRVSQTDLEDLSQWGAANGRSQADVRADIEALNRSRGGSGSMTCPVSMFTPLASAAPSDCGEYGTIDEAIQNAKDKAQKTEAELKLIEKKLEYWKLVDKLPMWRVIAYTVNYISAANNLGWFEPEPPSKVFPVIDRKYGRPNPWAGDPMTGRNYTNLPEAIKAWEASPDGQAAKAEKEEYQAKYNEKMERLRNYRSLPKDPNDIRNLGEPAFMLKQLGERQSALVTTLQRMQQDLGVWIDAQAKGEKCAFNTGPLGQQKVAPHPLTTAKYFVYVLEGIGFVISTEEEVKTKPHCEYIGGGGWPPCPGEPPATIAMTWGGPYNTEDEAHADLKSKLECHDGRWGPLVILDDGKWRWLQNNVTLDDCKTVKR